MPIMEPAAAYFPGIGVKLWMVLAGPGAAAVALPEQLADHDRQCRPGAVLRHHRIPSAMTIFSARLGMTSFALRGRTIEEAEGEAAHKEPHKERLIYPQEIEKVFATRTGARAGSSRCP
jgi:hypothetical protein